MNINRYTNNVSGVTLIELMIALVISSVLLLGVAKIYSVSKSSSKVNDDFAIMQEDGRIAMKFLIEDIRMAGYLGCAFNNGDSTKFQCLLANAGSGSYICDDFATGITGYDFVGTEAQNAATYTLTEDGANHLNTGSAAADWRNGNGTGLPAAFPAGAIVGSDIIIVRHGDTKSFNINSDKNSTDFTIDDQGAGVGVVGTKTCHTVTGGLCLNDILLASDCTKARVFQANQLIHNGSSIEFWHDNTGGPTPSNVAPLTWGDVADTTNHFLKKDTEISEFRTWAYFIALNPNFEPALFRQDGIGGDPAEELVEGIESMQILYGVDSNNSGTANYYASANQVDFTDITKPIVSIRISLLVRSKNEIPTHPSASIPYILSTTSITNAADKRLRKIFTTTIKIRNKGQEL